MMPKKTTKKLFILSLALALALVFGFSQQAAADDWLQPADWGDTAYVFERAGVDPTCRFELDDFLVPANADEIIGISFWMNKTFGCHFPTYFLYDASGQPGDWFEDRTSWSFELTNEGNDPNGNPVVRYDYNFPDNPVSVTPGATYWIALSCPPCPGHYTWGLHNTPLVGNGWGTNAKWGLEGPGWPVTPTGPYTDLEYPEGHEWHDQQVDVAFEIHFAGPLEAGFSGVPRTGVAPLEVDFTSEVTGGVEPYEYAWDLDGDGEFDDSTDPHPADYEYTSPDRYDVSLRVTDSGRTVITVTRERYIQVNEAGSQAGCVSLENPDQVWFLFGDFVTESCKFIEPMARPDGQDGHGLNVAADNITIDGNGHFLDGVVKACVSGTGLGDSGIYNGDVINSPIDSYDGVTIRNLEIKNFCNGIYLSVLEHNTIDCCEIHDNGDASVGGSRNAGIWQQNAVESTVSNCKIYSNESDPSANNPPGGHGIYLCAGNDNNWTGNDIYDNQKAGIFFRCSPQGTQITHNYVHENNFAGIRAQCRHTDNGLFESNYCSNNDNGAGIFVGGLGNTLQYNTCTENHGPSSGNGWKTGNGIRFDREAYTGTLYMNTCCDNEYEDIWVMAAGVITGSENACATTSNYNDPGVAACAYVGFKISGVVEKDGTPINDSRIDVVNRNEQTNPELNQWKAATFENDNTYHLYVGGQNVLNPDDFRDIAEGDTFRLIAKKLIDEQNWAGNTDHSVSDTDLNNGYFTEDLELDHFYRDLSCFPWYLAQDPVSKYSGPAVAQMWASYLNRPDTWWEEQQTLYDDYVGQNYPETTAQLLDPSGLRAAVMGEKPSGSYYFGIGRYNTPEAALHSICYYIDYEVYSAGDHPKNVPAAVPVYADTDPYYHNWMAVRGIHTSEDPWPNGGTYDVYGLWFNDPDPDGIGANSYKAAAEWVDNYYKAVGPSGDPCQGKWVAIIEPPDEEGEARVVAPVERFDRPITPVVIEESLNLNAALKTKAAVSNETLLLLTEELTEKDALDVIKAAIDGVTEELIPYDPLFASVFAGTVAGEPLPVKDDGGDFYLVPFNLPEKKMKNTVVVVVLVDAGDGSFKETSWVDDPVKYLPVSKEEALKLVFNNSLQPVFDDECFEKDEKVKKVFIELVNIDSKPYYPAWKITIDKKVFYVSQDGTVSM